ncbi:MAG: hypothetical protein M5R36_29760 [Deltaproteobacteria bacterium]|nr:hypothetical protein [Deltaproteobacteria bacterium]
MAGPHRGDGGDQDGGRNAREREAFAPRERDVFFAPAPADLLRPVDGGRDGEVFSHRYLRRLVHESWTDDTIDIFLLRLPRAAMGP